MCETYWSEGTKIATQVTGNGATILKGRIWHKYIHDNTISHGTRKMLLRILDRNLKVDEMMENGKRQLPRFAYLIIMNRRLTDPCIMDSSYQNQYEFILGLVYIQTFTGRHLDVHPKMSYCTYIYFFVFFHWHGRETLTPVTSIPPYLVS